MQLYFAESIEADLKRWEIASAELGEVNAEGTRISAFENFNAEANLPAAGNAIWSNGL